MTRKTSQLQIRISPEQKGRLRRLAEAAGTSISEYVLTRALPSPTDVERSLRLLPGASHPHKALSDLILSLRSEMSEGVAAPPNLDGLSAILRNRIAAAAELVASVEGRQSPDWVEEIEPLPRPSFSHPLMSLNPHLMRVSPAPFKKRNIFLDVHAVPALVESPPRTDLTGISSEFAGLEALDRILARSGVLGEICVSGGAVFTISYRKRWTSRRLEEVFGPPGAVDAAAAEVSATLSLPERWLARAARVLIASDEGPAYLELDNLRVFAASSEYVLAAKCAAARKELTDEGKDDLRFLLRFVGVTNADDALTRLLRYLTPRQLPDGVDGLLHELI